MEVYFNREGRRERSGALWEALSLDERMKRGRDGEPPAPYVIALVGAGGKTSLIRRLAWEGLGQKIKVLTVTTTHMYRPVRCGVFERSKVLVKELLDREGLAAAGLLAGEEKISFVGEDFYREICPLAGLVLVEADGSKRLPVKAPRQGEPVVPRNVDVILAVSGLSALGQRGEEACFRLREAETLLGKREPGWVIAPEDMADLMERAYLGPLRREFPGVPVFPVFNQADTPVQAEAAMDMLDVMGEPEGIVTGCLRGDPSEGIF